MDLRRLDHVGVIVEDLEAAKRLLGDLGLELTETLETGDLTAAFFKCGDASVEVIEVHDEAQRRKRLGDGNRARIEHIAFDVGDLEAALGALGALGVEPNAPPRRLPDRSMIWTEPETSGGIMFQFVQRH
jgi:methylmalonyl-CoA/ethylmalonyl-CoA epimerase